MISKTKMPDSNNISEIISKITRNNSSVLFLDTCAILDIVRAIGRGKQEDIIASVKRAMPDLVVADRRSLPDEGVEPRGTTLRQYAPRMYRFLQKNYTPLCRESEVVLLRRRKGLATHATALPSQCSDVMQSHRLAMSEEVAARGDSR